MAGINRTALNYDRANEDQVMAEYLSSIAARPHMAISPGFASTVLNLTREFWAPFFPAKKALLNAWGTTDYPLEYFLVANAGVPRIELAHRIIELKGAYGFPIQNEFVEAGLINRLERGAVEELGILPLCTSGDRLYCLVDRENQQLSPGQIARYNDDLLIVPIGSVSDLPARLEKLFKELDKHDTTNRRLGEYLVQLGMLSDKQLQEALEVQVESGEKLGMVLVRLTYISEPVFYESLAALLELPFYRRTTDLTKLVDNEFSRKLPRAYCERNLIIVLRHEGGTLWVATDEPKSLDKIHSISTVFHTDNIHIGVASPSSLRNAIRIIYGENEGSFSVQSPVIDVDRTGLPEVVEIGSGIPKFLDYLMYEGIRKKSSDIHIECYKKKVDIKLRIDGQLHKMANTKFISVKNVKSLLAKIKVDARLDIAEQRRPQDGVIRKRIDGQVVDFRVAIVPSLWGENAVLRILNQSQSKPKLEELGLSPAKLASFRRLVQNPQGLILVTGPTGSGKTTTLYAVLQELLKSARKIVTVEDPIEYAIEGVAQSQVDDLIGNTFDKYLRSFMRCDPEIILVGEIRDSETARMTARAALTGHLVLSTLHVSDSISTVRRLIDLGVEENLVSQILLGVVSQRLARKTCSHCSEVYKPDPDLVEEFFPAGVPRGARFTKGVGCPLCDHTGYAGRLSLVEFWAPDDDERMLIDAGADAQAIRGAAIAGGMGLLAADAVDKVLQGRTSLEEIRMKVPLTQIVSYRSTIKGNPAA